MSSSRDGPSEGIDPDPPDASFSDDQSPEERPEESVPSVRSGHALLIYLRNPTGNTSHDIKILLKKYFEPQSLGLECRITDDGQKRCKACVSRRVEARHAFGSAQCGTYAFHVARLRGRIEYPR
ncbi:hypothetical protein HPB47_021838 [Ixodes persulcatus]|uniref:Uncharacterized protein n=1 Tax=Ixodes persulcatus TaxID=34615 RepID=A0AC60QZP7_IXOPE|nr:hypothetical protein HPB47_021838 [Ixodes persulcatus]